MFSANIMYFLNSSHKKQQCLLAVIPKRWTQRKKAKVCQVGHSPSERGHSSLMLKQQAIEWVPTHGQTMCKGTGHVMVAQTFLKNNIKISIHLKHIHSNKHSSCPNRYLHTNPSRHTKPLIFSFWAIGRKHCTYLSSTFVAVVNVCRQQI